MKLSNAHASIMFISTQSYEKNEFPNLLMHLLMLKSNENNFVGKSVHIMFADVMTLPLL